jgi:hypothetical protein
MDAPREDSKILPALQDPTGSQDAAGRMNRYLFLALGLLLWAALDTLVLIGLR